LPDSPILELRSRRLPTFSAHHASQSSCGVTFTHLQWPECSVYDIEFSHMQCSSIALGKIPKYIPCTVQQTKSDCSLQKNCSECVTAPPRNHPSLRLRIPAGRASHAWLSHAPRATTEANTLRCIAEVPVFVNYLLFSPPPSLGYPATRQHQTECGLI
jgi:hypothetical protein